LEIQPTRDAIGLVSLKERNAVCDGNRRVRLRLGRANACQRCSANSGRDEEFSQVWKESSIHDIPFRMALEKKREARQAGPEG